MYGSYFTHTSLFLLPFLEMGNDCFKGLYDGYFFIYSVMLWNMGNNYNITESIFE